MKPSSMRIGAMPGASIDDGGVSGSSRGPGARGVRGGRGGGDVVGGGEVVGIDVVGIDG
jgi:hypothetical protein